MYEAKNPKELKKLLKEDKFPILIKDEKTIRVVEDLEQVKNGGKMGVISEATVVTLAIVTAVSFILLYAIYKDKNIKVVRKPDGTIIIQTLK